MAEEGGMAVGSFVTASSGWIGNVRWAEGRSSTCFVPLRMNMSAGCVLKAQQRRERGLKFSAESSSDTRAAPARCRDVTLRRSRSRHSSC